MVILSRHLAKAWTFCTWNAHISTEGIFCLPQYIFVREEKSDALIFHFGDIIMSSIYGVKFWHIEDTYEFYKNISVGLVILGTRKTVRDVFTRHRVAIWDWSRKFCLLSNRRRENLNLIFDLKNASLKHMFKNSFAGNFHIYILTDGQLNDYFVFRCVYSTKCFVFGNFSHSSFFIIKLHITQKRKSISIMTIPLFKKSQNKYIIQILCLCIFEIFL